MTFPELNNLHDGRPAVIIGKGPSLDAWLAAGCPQPEGAVRIGVNQVGCRVRDVAYSVSGDAQMDDYAGIHETTSGGCYGHGVWLRGVPYMLRDGSWVKTPPADWAENNIVPFEASVWHPERLYLTRDKIADEGCLYTDASSANPAVHLAWFLGCPKLILVGIDGGKGRAECMSSLPDRPGVDYTSMRKSVKQECDILFEAKWKHWAPPFRVTQPD